MKEKPRLWINLIVGLLAVIFVAWLAPAPNYQAHGILLPAKQTRPPISPSLIVQLPNAPYGGKIMGYINIENHYPMPGNTAQMQIGKLAQLLASQVGANAIVVDHLRLGAVTSSKFVWVLQATAYYVPSIQQSTLEPLLR